MPKDTKNKSNKNKYHPYSKKIKSTPTFDKKIICIYRISNLEKKNHNDFVDKIKTQKVSVLDSINTHYPEWKRDYIIEEKTEVRTISDTFRTGKKLSNEDFFKLGVFGKYSTQFKNSDTFNYKDVIFCFHAPDRACRSSDIVIQNELLQYQLYFSSINYFYPSIFEATDEQTTFLRQKFAEGAAESSNISTRIKSRNNVLRAEGKHVGRGKFGFKCVKGILTPIEHEQKIIQEIIDTLNSEEMNELHRQGKNVYQMMADKLNNENKHNRNYIWKVESISKVFDDNNGQEKWVEKYKYVCTTCYHRFTVENMEEDSIVEGNESKSGMCRYCKQLGDDLDYDVVVNIENISLHGGENQELNEENDDTIEEVDLYN